MPVEERLQVPSFTREPRSIALTDEMMISMRLHEGDGSG